VNRTKKKKSKHLKNRARRNLERHYLCGKSIGADKKRGRRTSNERVTQKKGEQAGRALDVYGLEAGIHCNGERVGGGRIKNGYCQPAHLSKYKNDTKVLRYLDY